MANSLGVVMSTERARIEAYLPVRTSYYSDYDEGNGFVGGQYVAQLHVANKTAQRKGVW